MAAEQFNFRVDTELKRAFIEKARENGTTASELLTRYMESYLGIEPRKPVAGLPSSEVDSRLSELEQRLVARIAALEEALPGKPQEKAA